MAKHKVFFWKIAFADCFGSNACCRRNLGIDRRRRFWCAALATIFKGGVLKTLQIVFGVIELLAGVFLIIELFTGDIFGKLDNLLMIIIWIVWIVGIVLGDFLGGAGLFKSGFSWAWLYAFASHVIVLGAMLCIND